MFKLTIDDRRSCAKNDDLDFALMQAINEERFGRISTDAYYSNMRQVIAAEYRRDELNDIINQIIADQTVKGIIFAAYQEDAEGDTSLVIAFRRLDTIEIWDMSVYMETDGLELYTQPEPPTECDLWSRYAE
jgi:hypothetical protein